jgi:hypothetical protein
MRFPVRKAPDGFGGEVAGRVAADDEGVGFGFGLAFLGALLLMTGLEGAPLFALAAAGVVVVAAC